MGGVVWVASYPRSGNTWIRVFLHSLLNAIDGREELDLNALAEFSTWDIAAHWYEPLLGQPPDQVTKEAVAAARPMAQRRIAGLALIFSLLATNAVPANPYFVSTLQTWVQGKFLNFDGAAQFLSVLWPFLALWFLYHPVHRRAGGQGAHK